MVAPVTEATKVSRDDVTISKTLLCGKVLENNFPHIHDCTTWQGAYFSVNSNHGRNFTF